MIIDRDIGTPNSRTISYNSVEAKCRELAASLTVLMIIYITDSLLFATSNISPFRFASRLVPILLLVIFAFKSKAKIRLSIIFVCISIIISMLLADRLFNGFSYISQVVLLLFAYFYAKEVSFVEFRYHFLNWMRIISVISLACFVLSRAILSMNIIPIITNTVNIKYRILFFSNIPMDLSLIGRNWGPFWEPGAYQFYLSLALLFSIFFDGYKSTKHKIFDVSLFTITALSTLSSAAILPMPFIILAYLLNAKQDSKERRIKLAIVLVFSVIILLAIFSGEFDIIIDKFFQTGQNNTSSSMGIRMGAILANIETAINHPIFGAAPELQDAIRARTIYGLNGAVSYANTNTLFVLSSMYGILVGLFYAYRLYAFSFVFSKKLFVRILVFIAIILTSSNEDFSLSSTFNVILFMGVEICKNQVNVRGGQDETQGHISTNI